MKKIDLYIYLPWGHTHTRHMGTLISRGQKDRSIYLLCGHNGYTTGMKKIDRSMYLSSCTRARTHSVVQRDKWNTTEIVT